MDGYSYPVSVKPKYGGKPGVSYIVTQFFGVVGSLPINKLVPKIKSKLPEESSLASKICLISMLGAFIVYPFICALSFTI